MQLIWLFAILISRGHFQDEGYWRWPRCRNNPDLHGPHDKGIVLSVSTYMGAMIINLRFPGKVFLPTTKLIFFSERLARFPESLSRASVLVDMTTCCRFRKVGIWRKGCKGQVRYKKFNITSLLIKNYRLPNERSEIFNIYLHLVVMNKIQI